MKVDLPPLSIVKGPVGYLYWRVLYFVLISPLELMEVVCFSVVGQFRQSRGQRASLWNLCSALVFPRCLQLMFWDSYKVTSRGLLRRSGSCNSLWMSSVRLKAWQDFWWLFFHLRIDEHLTVLCKCVKILI